MSERLAKRVLLIGWDAADWKLIDPLIEAGKMPNLERFISQGVMGNVATLQPVLSPMLWTSIATGKRADKHGIMGFVEPDGTNAKLRPVTSTSRKCKALWNILSQNGLRSAVVGWFASHPAERIRGCMVTNRFEHTISPTGEVQPLDDKTVHPRELIEVMGELRVAAKDLAAAQLLPFVPQAARVDQEKDRRLATVARLLAECSMIHNAGTWLAEHAEWDLLAIYYNTIDHFCHGFMQYHPPRMEHISEADFDIYKEVVTSCYRFHDLLLGRLMVLAGPETTVMIVSDHGFHSDHLRPKAPPPREGRGRHGAGNPVAWHRNHGILAVHGPHIKRDERVYGATLLDVAPTILAMLGLPIPEDMDGRPLTQVFDRAVDLDRIATYEGEHPDAGVHGEDEAEDPWVSQKMMAQLIELGYVEAPGEDEQKAVQRAMEDRMANLACVHVSAGRVEEALGLYRELLARRDTPGTRVLIAQCLMRLGRTDEARPLVEGVVALDQDAPMAHLLLGTLHFSAGETDAALGHLKQAEQADPRLPHLHCRIGQVYLRQRRWADAERAFRRALEIDGDSALAHDGLGVALHRLGRAEDAVYEFMCSISLLHHRPATHIHLGLALAETGQVDWAIRAFTVATELAPKNPFPHRCLARLYGRGKHDRAKARQHAALARSLRQ